MNGSDKLAGVAYDRFAKKLIISGPDLNVEAAGVAGLEVELKDGLLPSGWTSLNRVSCNSSYDR